MQPVYNRIKTAFCGQKNLSRFLFLTGFLVFAPTIASDPDGAGHTGWMDQSSQNQSGSGVFDGFEINFNSTVQSTRFITERELEIWASARNLAVIPDCPGRNLSDGEAAVIPHQGLEFTLSSRGLKRQFLYLDLVSFAPLQTFHRMRTDLYCQGSRDPEVRISGSGYDLPEVHWLAVFVNGKRRKLLYLGGGVFLKTPIAIAVEREDIQKGKIHVRLSPNTGNDYFAIWDAYLSDHPPD